MNSVEKMAAKDAARWAYAEMFFGEGAGTRRKLLQAEMFSKYDRIPGYEDLVHKYYAMQDFGDLAVKAAKERAKLDKVATRGKNLRAIKNGNFRNLSTGVFVVVVGGYYAHQLGYDKVALAEAKKAAKRAKMEYEGWRSRHRKLAEVINVYTPGDNGTDGGGNARGENN